MDTPSAPLDDRPATPLPTTRTERTRAALARAALALYSSRDGTVVTAARIAEAAGVTERTFFRHFRTKEEAVLLIHQGFDAALVGTLATTGQASPAQELARAYREVLAGFGSRTSARGQELLRVSALIAERPDLAAASLRLDAERADALLRHFAHEGRDELEIRMAIEVIASAVRVAFALWGQEGGTDDLVTLFDRCMSTLPRTSGL